MEIVNSFHNTLNAIDQLISFTIEEEEINQIAFLDVLVACKDNTLIVDVYRKPTHTDSYLDFFSHHDKRHEKKLNLFMSMMLYDPTITPKMSSPTF